MAELVPDIHHNPLNNPTTREAIYSLAETARVVASIAYPDNPDRVIAFEKDIFDRLILATLNGKQ